MYSLFLSGAHIVPDHLSGDVVARERESDGCRRGRDDACDGKDCQELAGKWLAECCHTGAGRSVRGGEVSSVKEP